MDRISVKSVVERARRKINAIITTREIILFLSLSMFGIAVVVLFSKFVALPLNFCIGVLIALFMLAGVTQSIRKKLNTLEAALIIDRHLKTKELITQAVEFEQTNYCSDYSNALIERAYRTIKSSSIKSIIPFKLGSCIRYFLVALVFCAVSIFIQIPVAKPVESTEDEKATPSNQTITKLQNVSKKLEKRAIIENSHQLRKLAQEYDKFIKKLQQQELTKRQAVAKAEKLLKQTRKIKTLADEKRNLIKELREKPLTQSIADAIKAKKHQEVLQKAIEAARDNPESLKEELKNIAKKTKELKEMLRSSIQFLDNLQTQEFAESMKELSQQLEDIPYDEEFEIDGELAQALRELENFEDEILERKRVRQAIQEEESSECQVCKGKGCNKCKAQGKGREGQGEGQGGGKGGIGTGRGGGHPPEAEPQKIQEVESEVKKAKRSLGPGPLKHIGKFIPRKVGEERSYTPLEEALPSYLEEAERSVQKDEIPPQYKNQVKEYFDRTSYK